MKKYMMRIYQIGLIVMCLLFCPGNRRTVRAEEAKNVQNAFSVDISTGEEKLSGVEVSLFRIGTIEKDGRLRLLEQYEPFGLSIGEMDEGAVRKTAETLEGIVTGEDMDADAYGRTDENGLLHFSGIKGGYYLLIAEPLKTDEAVYQVQPSLFSVPEYGTGTLTDRVSVWLKLKKETQKKTSFYVRKIWVGDNRQDRPAKITAVLQKDGKEYERFELTEANDWYKKFTNLDNTAVWTVRELSVPAGYTYTVLKAGAGYRLTNTKTPVKITVTPTPKSPPKKTTPPSGPVKQKKLPQTGFYNWNIPLFAGLGIAALFFGILLRRRRIASLIALCLGAACILGAGAQMVYQIQVEKEAYRAVSAEQRALHDWMTEETISEEAGKQGAGTAFHTNGVMETDAALPTRHLNGRIYVGMLAIPSLGLELPIQEETTKKGLKISPCRFEGTPYQKNMIIAGHRIRAHFSGLKELGKGDRLSFTDMDGRIFEYYIDSTEVVGATDVEKMESGDWDMTLFTCTYGGGARYALRCKELAS